MWSLLVAAALAVSVDELRSPLEEGDWVSDPGDRVPAAVEEELSRQIDGIERDLGVEVALVVVDHVEPDDPRRFATELFQRWGVGRANADNGLLLLVVTDSRRAESEVGFGLEGALPDGFLGGLQSDVLGPRMQRGDLGGGLAAWLDGVETRLRRDPSAFDHGDRIVSTRWSVVYVGLSVAVALGLLFVLALTVAVLGYWRYRSRRTCPTCRIAMPLLDEAADDAHLDAGARREEAIGSIDYRVHQCPKCSQVRVFPKRLWSRHVRCPSCKRRTLGVSGELTALAAPDRPGVARIVMHCAHCGYRSSREQRTSPLTDLAAGAAAIAVIAAEAALRSGGVSLPSGGSGSEGSDRPGGFGGGRSGGGGAGTSW